MILIPVSGGIDSTALLWKYSRDNNIYAFHLTLGRNVGSKMHLAELWSTRNVITWMKRNTLKEIIYEEYEIFREDPLRKVHSHYAVQVYCGIMLKRVPKISHVISGLTGEDKERSGFHALYLAEGKIIREMAGRQNFILEAPYLDSSKAEIKASIPYDLLKITLSCWFPNLQDDGSWIPCNMCGKCEEAS